MDSMTQSETCKVQIQPLAFHQDSRGMLFEPVNVDELSRQRNAHVVLTAPRQVRGNHWHRRSTETTVVVGPCLVRLKQSNDLRDVQVPAGEVWQFTLPPGVVHAYQNIGEGIMVLISFASEIHDPADPDTIREVIL